MMVHLMHIAGRVMVQILKSFPMAESCNAVDIHSTIPPRPVSVRG